MSWYRLEDNSKLILSLYIQPGAKMTQFAGLHGDAIKISIAAPPVEGKANKVLIKFLADRFQVALGNVRIKRGEHSRYKLVEIKQSTIDPNGLLTKKDH